MNRDDLILLLLILALLLAALFTILTGGARSRHGVGAALTPAASRPLCVTAGIW